APGGTLGLLVVFLGLSGRGSGLSGLFLGLLARGFLLRGAAGLLLGATSGLFFELGGDQRVVFRAPINLLDDGSVFLAVGLEALLALEGLNLLDGHFQLVRYPRVGATLSHPPADLVKLRTQGPAAHRRAGD